MKKEENPLNILTLKAGYRWIPSCWVKNIKFELRKFKYAWDRITKGYCDWDVFDLDYFYTNLFIDSLKHYLSVNNGWPQSDEFPEYKDYEEYIKKIIYHFEQSREGYEDIKNEFSDEYTEKILDKPNFFENLNKEKTPEEEELSKKYFNREMELARYREKHLNKGLNMLKHIFQSLWW